MNEPVYSIEPIAPTTPPSALQFDRAELEDATKERQTPECAFCRTPLHASYFDINGQMSCEVCRFKVEEQLQKGPGVAGFLRAGGAGLVAAIVGSGLYYGVRALTGYEIGLISILVGLMVGKAVSWGARGRGGWVYQTLAMFLTYMAIVSTYIPLLFKEIQGQKESKPAVTAPSAATSGSAAAPVAGQAQTSEPPTDASKVTFAQAMLGLIAIFALAAVLPFLAGFENVIGLLIIAFGLWEAWKLNKRQKVEILGPLDLGRAPDGSASRNLMRCPGCGTEVSPARQSCPLCRALIHAEELKRLAREAEDAETDRPADALNAWRSALELLPPESGQARAIGERAEALSRRVEVGGAASGGKARGWRNVWKGGGVVAILIFLLTKGKFLLLGLTKVGTLGTMLLSLGVYWSLFGWRLALGLILSIYVHEMGHVAALRKLGFPASAPTFIPGLGAFIRLKQRPVSPREDARVGLAGPIWGLAAALFCWGVHLAGGGPIWAAVARIGAWINLFNLLPLGPLDGGRAFGALSKNQRIAIAAWIGGVWFFVREGLLLLLLIGAVLWLFNPRKTEVEGDRLAFFQYAGLVAVLAALCLLKVPGAP